jgi:putative transposase
MQIHKAYRYELDPTPEQRVYFTRCCGTARFVYNRALAARNELYRSNEGKARFTTAFDQMKDIGQLKQMPEFSWIKEVDARITNHAILHLEGAYKNLYADFKAGRKPRFPKFKRKGKCRDSFTVSKVTPKRYLVRLPKIGAIRSKEHTAVEGRVLSATVSREADRWYVAIATEQEIADPAPVQGPVVGVDLGLKTFATLSDGTTITLPKRLSTLHERLKWASHLQSRKQRGSQNRRKATLRLARVYRKIKNTRANFIHEVTTSLAKTKQAIVIEDLSVKDMTAHAKGVCKTSAQARSFNRKILAGAFGEFRRQLEYKTVWYGSKLIVVDRYYPSSQICSRCGCQQQMPLDVRVYRCKCGLVIDRDLNAALNLESFATAMPAGSHACGDGGCTTNSDARRVPVERARRKIGSNAHHVPRRKQEDGSL